jgi:hypothetical protein
LRVTYATWTLFSYGLQCKFKTLAAVECDTRNLTTTIPDSCSDSHPTMGRGKNDDQSRIHGGRGRGRLGHQEGGEAVTPAVTRHRSTGVHSRIDYTSDQLERLTTPSPSTPHGVHSRIGYTGDQLDRPTPPSPSTPPQTRLTPASTTSPSSPRKPSHFIPTRMTNSIVPWRYLKTRAAKRSTSVFNDTPRTMKTTMRTRHVTPGQSRATRASGSVHVGAVPTGPTDLEALAESSRNRATRPPKIYSG